MNVEPADERVDRVFERDTQPGSPGCSLAVMREEDLAQYAGRYCSPELDLYWTIEAGDDHLLAQRRKYADSKLSPVFADAFRHDWTPLMGYPTTYLVVYERNAHEHITGLRVSGTRVRNLRFVRC